MAQKQIIAGLVSQQKVTPYDYCPASYLWLFSYLWVASLLGEHPKMMKSSVWQHSWVYGAACGWSGSFAQFQVADAFWWLSCWQCQHSQPSKWSISAAHPVVMVTANAYVSKEATLKTSCFWGPEHSTAYKHKYKQFHIYETFAY